MICQHNDTTCHGSLCLGELFSCEILSLNVLSGSIFDLQVQHWSEGSQTQRRHTSSSCQRLHFKSCNNVHSLLMELVQPPPPLHAKGIKLNNYLQYPPPSWVLLLLLPDQYNSEHPKLFYTVIIVIGTRIFFFFSFFERENDIATIQF